MGRLTLTIDGMRVEAEENKTVLEVALDAGIHVPRLCHDPDLAPYGACRLCIVEIDGMRGFQTSCTTAVREGMVVRTETDALLSARRMTVELLIADHPQDCLSCSSNGRCKLQEIAAYLGVDRIRPRRTALQPRIDDSNPFFLRDESKCVLCGICVRACDEIRGQGAIDFALRGYETRIVPFGAVPIAESVCKSCAECVDRCPTGALVARREKLPPTRETRTTCPYCGVGCGLVLGTRAGRIVRVLGDREHPVNRGRVCVKGRFELEFVHSPERLTKPLIRRNGELEEASWDEALELVAEQFKRIKKESGPDAIAGLSSAKCTNEENYLFQKLMRACIGTNNVDHCARLCHASTVAGLARAFGSGAMTNSIDELEFADCILVTGSNTTEAHPVLALKIKDAVRRHGAKLIVADPRAIDLVPLSELHLRQKSGTDVFLFNAMMRVIIEEGLADEEFVRERTENSDEFRETVMSHTPDEAEKVTGVAADDIRRAARIYARAERASIVYSMGITQHTTGTDNVLTLANLAMLTGNVGRASTGVNPLRGQNNVQGACDLAALPNVFPGYQKVTDDALRGKFEQAWGAELPAEVGLTVVEMMHAIEDDRARALYVMGENPAMSDPNLNRTRAALEKTEFLVVQDIFLTETARYADVVLPSACFAEKDGTFTNTERRVQRVCKAVEPPGEARADWRILCDVSTALGYPMSYPSPAEVMHEVASVTPIYGGMSYARLDEAGLQWPCRSSDDAGTRFLHEGKFTRGKGRFHAVQYRDPAEVPDADYPYRLTTGRMLHQFHTGTMTRKVEGVDSLGRVAPVELNPADAAREGVTDGQEVVVESRRGHITARAFVTDRVPPSTLFVPFHFWEAPANILTNDALDPVAKIPEFKVCAVRVRLPEDV